MNTLKIRMIFLLLTLQAISHGAVGKTSVPIEGKWFGMAGFQQDRIEVGLEIKRNARGELKVYLYEPVVNFYGLELPGVLKEQNGGYVLDAYALKVSLQNDRLEGTYLPLNAPISLKRTGKLPKEVSLPRFRKGPDPKWRLKLGGAIYAPVAVYEGIAYVGTTGGMFYAVHLKDGTFAWAFAAGRAVVGEAVATHDAIYFVCDNGYLYKLNRVDGTEVWRYDLGDERASRILEHPVGEKSGDFDFDHYASRPLLMDGVIYLGSGNGTFHAIEGSTGKNIWKFQGKGKIRTNAATDGSRLFFGTYENLVYALDRANGKQLWNRDTYAQVTSSPVLVNDRLIIGNRGGVLVALKPETGETIWRMTFWGSSVESTAAPGEGSLFYIGSSDMRRVSLIDSTDGRVLWRTDVFGWAWPTPLVTQNRIYMSVIGVNPYQMRHLGSLNALDRATGKIVWRWAMPECPGCWLNGFAASPVLDHSLLIVGGLDGTLYAFPVSES